MRRAGCCHPSARSSRTALLQPAVLVEQVDPVGAEPAQRGVGDALDLPGAAVEPGGPAVLDAPAEFGGDDRLVPQRLEGLADEFLVDMGPYTSAVSKSVMPSATASRRTLIIAWRSPGLGP